MGHYLHLSVGKGFEIEYRIVSTVRHHHIHRGKFRAESSKRRGRGGNKQRVGGTHHQHVTTNWLRGLRDLSQLSHIVKTSTWDEQGFNDSRGVVFFPASASILLKNSGTLEWIDSKRRKKKEQGRKISRFQNGIGIERRERSPNPTILACHPFSMFLLHTRHSDPSHC